MFQLNSIMEVINSFFSNIKDKLTNPFFGTLIIVLIIHHWELWYATFNFDKGFTLDEKIEFIKNYVAQNITFHSFIWDIIQAVIYMFIGYLIVIGTRSLILWIEFGLMPFITGKIVNKNVVRRSEYEDVVKEREEYFDQYEEQRKNVRSFSKTIDEQNEQIKQKDKNLLEQSRKISDTVNELDITKVNLEKSHQKVNDTSFKLEQSNNSLEELQGNYDNKIIRLKKYEDLFLGKENEEFYVSMDKFPPEVLKKVQELKNTDKWNLFLTVASFYQNGGTIGGEAVTEMIQMDLAFDRDNHEELTPVGQIIWKYRKIFDSKDIYKIF